MFYHVKVGITGIASWFNENKTKDEVLVEYICPFLNREVTIRNKSIFNTTSWGSITIYATEKPIDSDWPIKKSEYADKDGDIRELKYEGDLKKYFEENGENISTEIFKEALILIENSKYKELRSIISEKTKGRETFFICPFGNDEVDHNYNYVIKPTVEKYQFTINRADEISHTRRITDTIIASINRSRFIVADLTEAKPNCYYEVGYSHSIGKPVILIAKTGTERHFDLAEYKWNYWDDYKDLKTKFEKELEVLLKERGLLLANT